MGFTGSGVVASSRPMILLNVFLPRTVKIRLRCQLEIAHGVNCGDSFTLQFLAPL